MNAYRGKKFNWRAFVSLYMTLSFLIMIVSGFILYLAPAGRIAKWTHIYILGLEKEEWQAIHTIFTFLFVIAGGFHLWYNWKPLLSYLRRKLQNSFALRKELYVSSLFTILLFAFTLYNLPPFSTVMEWGEALTESWESEETEPPVPHAEAMTFSELAQTIDKPVEVLISSLKTHHINVEKDEIIKDAAERNDLSPMELFEKMNTVNNISAASPYAGRGLGRKSLQEVCQTLQLDMQESVHRLEQNGIKASPEMTLKDIAANYDMKPVDILNMINLQTTGN